MSGAAVMIHFKLVLLSGAVLSGTAPVDAFEAALEALATGADSFTLAGQEIKTSVVRTLLGG